MTVAETRLFSIGASHWITFGKWTFVCGFEPTAGGATCTGRCGNSQLGSDHQPLRSRWLIQPTEPRL
jgi:hypothetical protein